MDRDEKHLLRVERVLYCVVGATLVLERRHVKVAEDAAKVVLRILSGGAELIVQSVQATVEGSIRYTFSFASSSGGRSRLRVELEHVGLVFRGDEAEFGHFSAWCLGGRWVFIKC